LALNIRTAFLQRFATSLAIWISGSRGTKPCDFPGSFRNIHLLVMHLRSMKMGGSLMRMKIKSALTLLSCSIIMASLLSCGSGSSGSNTIQQIPLGEEGGPNASTSNSQNPLLGTWVSGNNRLAFKTDNIYSRDPNLSGMSAVRGSFTVSGNVILVTDADSCINGTTGETTSGSYTYTISGNTLTFDLFHDPCSERAAFLMMTYTKQ
jgi:hypothetical protein